MINQDNLGDALRIYRETRKMTQQEVADKAGISRSYLAAAETTTYPLSLKTLFKVLDAIGVQMRLELKKAGETGAR
jgi:phage replication initiation protein